MVKLDYKKIPSDRKLRKKGAVTACAENSSNNSYSYSNFKLRVFERGLK